MAFLLPRACQCDVEDDAYVSYFYWQMLLHIWDRTEHNQSFNVNKTGNSNKQLLQNER